MADSRKVDNQVTDAAGDAPVEGAGRNHEKNIERLFEEHNQALLRFIAARLQSRQEAMEIAQEAYVRLLKLDEPSTVSYLRAYLFRIAANLVTDRLKQRHRRKELRDLVFFGPEENSPPPDTVLNARDELAALERAIGNLPAKCRKAFVLHKIQDLSIEQVAQQMNLSGRMVRLYVARALAHCREELDDAERSLHELAGTDD